MTMIFPSGSAFATMHNCTVNRMLRDMAAHTCWHFLLGERDENADDRIYLHRSAGRIER